MSQNLCRFHMSQEPVQITHVHIPDVPEPVHIPDVPEPVHIPDVPETPVHITHVPESPVQIPDVPEPPVQIPDVPEPPVQIPDVPPPLVQIPDVPQPRMQIPDVPKPPVQIPQSSTLWSSTLGNRQMHSISSCRSYLYPQLLHTIPSIFDRDLISFLDEFERELAMEPMDLTMPRLNPCVKKSIGFKAIQPMDLSVNK
ncbi:hypothetical protein TNCV_550071 [Trichonephila clavipes]|nr:hypothetical protein TNCV_550071 [Trichonephila clavipes]